MNKNQQAQALLTLYAKKFEERYGFEATLNRYRLKWGATDFIDSVGYDRAKKIIEYYLSIEANHTFENLLGSFEKIEEMMVARQEDNERRARLREETRRRVEEFERGGFGN